MAATSYAQVVQLAQPQLSWRMEEASGTVVADSSGYGLTGTATATGVTRAVAGAISAGGNAIRLDGATGGITAGDVLDFGLSDWTFEFWIKTTAVAAEQGIIGKYATLTPFRPFYEIMLTDDGAYAGRIRAGYDDGSGTILSCYGPWKVNDGAWHHVIVVFDRDAGVTVWTDGDACFVSGKRLLSMNSNGVLRVGGNAAEAGPRLAADLDEISAYSYAFSDERAREHHTWGRIKVPVVVPALTGIAAKAPIDTVDVDWERDPQRMRYRRAILASSPDHYYPFDGVSVAAKLADAGAGTAKNLLDSGVVSGNAATAAVVTADTGNSWTNPTNAQGAPGGGFATAATPSSNANVKRLRGTVFGLVAKLPGNATVQITQVVAQFNGFGSSVQMFLQWSAAWGGGGNAGRNYIPPNAPTSGSTNSTATGTWTPANFADPSVIMEVTGSSGDGVAHQLSADAFGLSLTFTGASTFAIDTTHKLQEDVNDSVAVFANGEVLSNVGLPASVTNGFSFEVWVKPGLATPSNIEWIWTAGAFNTATLTRLTTGKLRFSIDVDGGGQATLDSPAALAAGAWVHVVCVWDKTNKRLLMYLNGEEAARLDDYAAAEDLEKTLVTTWQSGVLGVAAGLAATTRFTGSLDEVALYGYALADIDPRIHYRAATDTDPTERFQGITYRVKQISWRRRRNSELDRMEAGELQVTVDNTDRALEPEYVASPYYPNVRSSRAIRHRKRYPANLAEDPFFDVAAGSKWTAVQTNGSMAAQIAGQSPPYGTLVARAVRATSAGAAYLSMTMVDRIPVQPDVVTVISFYAKKVGTPSPKLAIKAYEIDERNRNHGARALTATAVAVSGATFPNAVDVGVGWGRYGAAFVFPRSIREVVLELVLMDTPITVGILTVYASSVQVERRVLSDDVAAGQWYERFNGIIESFPSSQPSHRRQELQLTANDGRRPLRAGVLRGAAPAQAGGARITSLLDRAMWRTDRRRVDAGAQTMAAQTYANENPLEEAAVVADSELGVFFIDGDGYATFQDGGHRMRVSTSAYAQAIFGDGDEQYELPYVALARDSGDSFVRNNVTVTPYGTPGEDINKSDVSGSASDASPLVVTVVGVKPGDAINATPGARSGSASWAAYASAVDTVTIVVASTDPANLGTVSGPWRINSVPEPVVTTDQSSFDYQSSVRHGVIDLNRETRLASTTAAKAQADTLLARYREERLRYTLMVVEPRRDARLWPVVLARGISDLLTIKERPQVTVPREYRDALLTDEPAAYWMLEDLGGSGITVVDEVGRAGATPNGLSPGVTTNTSDLAESPLAQRLGARYFDGTGDFITVGDVSGVRWTGDVTWEAWIRTDVSDNLQRAIMGKDVLREGSLYVESDGRLTYKWGNGTTTQTLTTGGAVIVRNGTTWQHVVVRRDITNGLLSLIVGGVAVAGAAPSYAAAGLGSSAFTLGRAPGAANDFKGSLAHVAIHPFALSDARIAQRLVGAARGVMLPATTPTIRNAYVEGIEETVQLSPYSSVVAFALSS